VVVEGWPDTPDTSGASGAAVTAGELTAWVRDSLGSFKAPARVELLEELPTTATGKVLRRTVRDQLAGG
jgi:acyl-coenzyme A synthetase/AMP-(fatty) acid ligase